MGKEELSFNGYRICVGNDLKKKVLGIDSGDGYIHCECI